MTSPWKQWLERARITDNPAGHIIADARRDRCMPDRMASQAALRRYLLNKDACEGALAAVPEVWRRYRQWRDGNARALSSKHSRP